MCLVVKEVGGGGQEGKHLTHASGWHWIKAEAFASADNGRDCTLKVKIRNCYSLAPILDDVPVDPGLSASQISIEPPELLPDGTHVVPNTQHVENMNMYPKRQRIVQGCGGTRRRTFTVAY